jgi:hypothetical protein
VRPLSSSAPKANSLFRLENNVFIASYLLIKN